MKLTGTVVARVWGASMGMVIPFQIVNKLGIKPGTVLEVTFEKIE